MGAKYKASIFLFNRDLRIQDNECLNQACAESEVVYLIFIFTLEQITNNKYVNERSIAFMCDGLIELARSVPITFYQGKTIDVLADLIDNVDAVFNNMDVTPFARARSDQIAKLCKRSGVDFIQGNDVFLVRHTRLTKADGKPYLKFTPFYNNAVGKVLGKVLGEPADKPASKPPNKLSGKFGRFKTGDSNLPKKIKKDFESNVFVPGRAAAMRAIKAFVKSNTNYAATRDIPVHNKTTHLSAYLHFGIIGPNEVVNALKGTKNYKDIVRQLLWREFYLYVIWMSHTDYTKKSRTIPANNRIKWRSSPADYKRWCVGRTGCPIVDAGMRELNETGYMQNRLRMIVAMYLIYHLHIDWRLGEKYFAQNLCDYDYCNNLGGWMWSAGWESHSNDYYRPFSMASQMKRFDPDASYTKKWVPEIRDVPAKDLYDWDIKYVKYPKIKYLPIGRWFDARAKGIEMYKKAR